MKKALAVFLVFVWGLTLAPAPPASAAEMGSGWTRPIDSPVGSYAGWMASGCNGAGAYIADRYHIGVDIGGPVGTPVRSLGNGTVIRVWRDGSWGVTNGQNNAGIWVQYQAGDGSQFVAVYGHVVPAAGIGAGTSLGAGQVIASVGVSSYGAPPHLHLGIRPGTTIPSSSWGMMACASWPNTNGFADPNAYLTQHPNASSDGNPFGFVDGAVGLHGGGVFVRGWALDPDTANSIEVHVYVDGGPGSGARGVSLGGARMFRPDVDAVHHKGAYHGFSTGFTGLSSGGHTLYFYGINAAGTPGANPLIGQVAINVPANTAGSPYGNGDAASPTLGGVRLTGWGVDPDVPTSPIRVHAYLDGPAGSDYRGFDLGEARVPRGDVAAAFPGVGPNHGLDTTIAAEPGPHSVFLYAINRAGGGENPIIGVLNVDVPSGSPVGTLDAASGGDRAIKLTGWAIDPDAATAAVTIHAYVDGPAGQGAGHDLGAATISRGDVAAAHPVAGAAHGFEASIPNVGVGRHGVWVYALDRKSPGENVLIGQSTVTVAAAPARPAPPTAAPGDRGATVSWTAPDPGTSPITGYEVRANPGGASCSAGADGRTCTVGGLANGTSYTFSVRARNAVGASAWSAASAGVMPTATAAPSSPAAGGGAGGNPPVGTGGAQVVVAAPAAVTGVRVAFPAKRTAVLTWTAPPSATTYRVRVSKRNSTKKWRAWTTVGTPSVTLTRLKKKGTYRLQIAPAGPGGVGPTSTWRFKQKK